MRLIEVIFLSLALCYGISCYTHFIEEETTQITINYQIIACKKYFNFSNETCNSIFGGAYFAYYFRKNGKFPDWAGEYMDSMNDAKKILSDDPPEDNNTGQPNDNTQKF